MIHVLTALERDSKQCAGDGGIRQTELRRLHTSRSDGTKTCQPVSKQRARRAAGIRQAELGQAAQFTFCLHRGVPVSQQTVRERLELHPADWV